MSLVVRDPAAPVRLTGSPARWALDFAIGGALVPLSLSWVPWFVGFGSALNVAAIALPGAALGAAVGAASPILLNAFRRGVPLWLLTVLASVTGAAAMVVAWGLAGAHSGMLLALLFTAGGGSGAVLWLPYTVATVTRRATWPVVLAVAVASPLLALFPLLAFLLFP